MSFIYKIWNFYYSGFKGMTVGKTLWVIILIKLFVLFFILKLFFFKSDLADCKTESEKSERVIENLISPIK